jgi:hypothetical protein
MTTKSDLHDRPVGTMSAAHGGPSPNHPDGVADSQGSHHRQKSGVNYNWEVILVVLMSVVLTIVGLRVTSSEDRKELESVKTQLP